jgi:hypothetical protein
MNEEQFKRLALWQQRADLIQCKVERYFEALQLFGDDDNFEVWLDGSVGFIDHSKAQTFEEACGYEYSPQYWADRERFVAEHGYWL